MDLPGHFQINKNKIFLKDESFFSKSINPESEIIEKDYNNELETSTITRNHNILGKKSKLDKIPASALYSVTLKNKNLLDNIFKEDENESGSKNV